MEKAAEMESAVWVPSSCTSQATHGQSVAPPAVTGRGRAGRAAGKTGITDVRKAAEVLRLLGSGVANLRLLGPEVNSLFGGVQLSR